MKKIFVGTILLATALNFNIAGTMQHNDDDNFPSSQRESQYSKEELDQRIAKLEKRFVACTDKIVASRPIHEQTGDILFLTNGTADRRTSSSRECSDLANMITCLKEMRKESTH